MADPPDVLRVDGLVTTIGHGPAAFNAVDGVSFTIPAGSTLGLVGESGSGKSMCALSIVDLVPSHVGQVTAGSVVLDGRNITGLPRQEMDSIRGKDVGFIFQDPMSCLNPTQTVGAQVSEPLRIHEGLTRRAADDQAAELLTKVGIPRARHRLGDYPHQFSGGMRQRVMIAIALACRPRLIIADEPTTALDVTVQAQILELMRSLSNELGTAVLLITHDLSVAAGVCDRVNVMYAGQLVEQADVDDFFTGPQMPYSQGLLDCLPRIDDSLGEQFRPIPGQSPDLSHLPGGCRFAPRCRFVRDLCLETPPSLTDRGRHWLARCHATASTGGWL